MNITGGSISECYIVNEYIDISLVWNRRKFTSSTRFQRLIDSLRKWMARK